MLEIAFEIATCACRLGVPLLVRLSSWGGLSRLLAALRTRDDQPSRSGPKWEAAVRP